MDPIKVVVRMMDGKVMKGFAQNFNPTRPTFHLSPETAGTGPDKKADLLDMKDIKAIFFVKSFEGNRNYDERKTFESTDVVQGRRAEVGFKDGEILRGSTVGYDPQRLGFFLIPIDALSNNIRIFIVSNAVKSFRFL